LLIVAGISGLAQQKRGNVTIDKDAIIIHPGTNLSAKDEKALDQIMQKYDKALYRIDTYKNGKLVRRLGTLKNSQVDKKVASEVAQAKAEGESDRTVQFEWRQLRTPPIVTGQVISKPAPERAPADAPELLKELKPILQKYQSR
jgi:hypothetical protein